ncbi:2-oxo acid dehydrogenase subunit E2 [Candidatus Bathyarchaeota archaeon]|nr:MAG: 2-oxo acid dehydrogenase subunit E2 [Candidatus Bathyarchaeota archaeon]
MRRILMPRMDVDMDRGSVVEWMKGEGEAVEEGEPLVKIMSEKVTYEVPSPASGILHKILVPAGEEVPIGQVIGILREEGDREEDLEAAVEEALRQLRRPEAGVEVRRERRAPRPVRRRGARIRTSPVARRLAEEYGIDLGEVVGTGPGGRITKEDVLRFVEEASQFSETIPLRGIRRVVAERMSESFRTAPHAVVSMDVNMSHVVELRRRLRERGVEVSYNAILIKAAAEALREFPILNSTLRGDEIRVWRRVNICVAIDTPKGLVAPVVKDADQRSLVELTKAVEDLAERARGEGLRRGDLKGGTFTITNLGMFGVDRFQPIINPPQAAILAVGRITERPVVEEGKVVVRPVATLSLAFDHRIVDGAPAARFLRRLREILQTIEA